MSTFLALFFGAVAIFCASVCLHAPLRARVLRHLPLRRRTYAIAAVWFVLAVVIIERGDRIPSERRQRLRLAGATLSLLTMGSFAWDYRRLTAMRSREPGQRVADSIVASRGPGR